MKFQDLYIILYKLHIIYVLPTVYTSQLNNMKSQFITSKKYHIW